MLNFNNNGKLASHKITRSTGYLTGKLLIATPKITDVFFNKTVIFICYHDESGAIGYIINKRLSDLNSLLNSKKYDLLKKEQQPINEYLQTTKLKGKNILFGGPLFSQRVFILHTDINLAENSMTYKESSLAICLNIHQLPADLKKQHDLIIGLGFSSWSPNQLEYEIKQNDWVVVDADKNLIFEEDLNIIWQKTAKNTGIDINRVRENYNSDYIN